jgi:alkylation response protein AidB-like acyl-CoA dehydrogenase
VDVLSTAERLADEVLFPAALTTDTADAVPVDLLDTLAEAGLYGLSGPISGRWHGR